MFVELGFGALLALLLVLVFSAVRILREYERGGGVPTRALLASQGAVLGKHELDELLAGRERLNTDIQQVLDAQTDVWGIKVANVEIEHVDLNESMIRAKSQLR